MLSLDHLTERGLEIRYFLIAVLHTLNDGIDAQLGWSRNFLRRILWNDREHEKQRKELRHGLSP
jgi:hypothetical protein